MDEDAANRAHPAARLPGNAHPTYAARFRCIESKCEDTCCQGWAIPLDETTYRHYQQFPDKKLAAIVAESVHITPAPAAHASRYAQITPTASGNCPFFDAERLCGIQKTYGHELLSTTCSVYPRALNRVEGALEGSLYLSCPEAARNVLLDADAFSATGDLAAGAFRLDFVVGLGSKYHSATRKPYGDFQALRALLTAMVQDRTRPVWQRLLLIGSLCSALDAATANEAAGAVGAVLEEHRQILAQGLLLDQLNALPAQLELKLKIILRLTDERVRDKTSGRRFEDSFWMFVEGIGTPEGGTASSDVERYREANALYAAPFFGDRPHIFENFLLNYIFQNLFPFGRETSIRFTERSMFDEYILLASQFAWIETLLIGVAGCHKQAFGEAHVVQVVQSFCRAIEHNPYVLISITELMTHLQMNNLAGMAALLKN